METLTDLEAAALGCVHRHQPCTAHFVRTRFRTSPSARFSDSAGSVYPMMKRLEQRGLVASRERQEGRRRVRYLKCTAKGRTALGRWVGPPFGRDVGLTIDPLRTRMLYVELLEPARRAAWLDEAEQVLRQQDAQLDLLRAEAADPEQGDPDPWLQLAHENARLENQARLDWLRLARRRLRRQGLLD